MTSLLSRVITRNMICVGTEEPAKQVWMNGPAPCGEIPDITLYRGGDEKTPIEDRDKSALYFQTPEGKMWVADSAYAGEYERIIVTMDEMSERDIKWLNRLKARGETLHGRLKSFNVLGNVKLWTHTNSTRIVSRKRTTRNPRSRRKEVYHP